MPRRVHLITYGCQMNKLDSERLADRLRAAGHRIVPRAADADCVVINTCAVRQRAEEKVLSRAGQFKPRATAEPDFLLALTGCFAERAGEALFAKLPHLRLLVGTRHQEAIAQWLDVAERGRVCLVGDRATAPSRLPDPPPPLPADPPPPPPPRARPDGVGAFVAAMRGCDNHCAYCVVPRVRGPEASRPPADVIDEVRQVVAAGAREVTLLGQNIDAYGRGTGADLADLLQRIHDAVGEGDGLLRLRFVTSHPRDITERLVRTVAALPRVCDHFHMPAQSGSDRILAAMGRGYSRAEYDDKLAMIRQAAPGALVASDFIVGFPGETDDDFAATEELVAAAQFQNSYIFKYSPRPGTRAEAMGDDVPPAVKKERNRRLLARQRAVGEARAAALAGTRQTMLVEGVSPRDRTRLVGRTPRNLIVVIPAPADAADAAALVGRPVTVEIESGTALTLLGRTI